MSQQKHGDEGHAQGHRGGGGEDEVERSCFQTQYWGLEGYVGSVTVRHQGQISQGQSHWLTWSATIRYPPPPNSGLLPGEESLLLLLTSGASTVSVAAASLSHFPSGRSAILRFGAGGWQWPELWLGWSNLIKG